MELREGETIIHKARPHWIVFGWAILLSLVSACFMLGTDLATRREAMQVCLIIAGMLFHEYRVAYLPSCRQPCAPTDAIKPFREACRNA
jgi:hypothetical protein